MKGDDTSIEELLLQVGARDEPSAEMTLEVQAAVHAEWQSMLRARRTRRQFIAVGIAASAVLAVGVAFFGVRYMAPTPVQVAQITRIDGHLLVRPQGQTARELAVAQNVSTGETIQTDDRSRAALQFGAAVSLRLDQGTIVKVASADELVLTAGIHIFPVKMHEVGSADTDIRPFENVELYRHVPFVLRPYFGRRLHLDQIDTFDGVSDQEIGSNADVVGGGCSLVDRGRSCGQRLARHGNGALVIEIGVIDQYATREPLPSEFADRGSGIQCESSNGVDWSGELWLEALEIEPLMTLQAGEKASLRKRRVLSRFDHSLSTL